MNPFAGFGPDATHSSPAASATAVAAISGTVSGTSVAVTVAAAGRGVLVAGIVGDAVEVATGLATTARVGEAGTSVDVAGAIVGTAEATKDTVGLGSRPAVADGLTGPVGALVGAETTVDAVVTAATG